MSKYEFSISISMNFHMSQLQKMPKKVYVSYEGLDNTRRPNEQNVLQTCGFCKDS